MLLYLSQTVWSKHTVLRAHHPFCFPWVSCTEHVQDTKFSISCVPKLKKNRYEDLDVYGKDNSIQFGGEKERWRGVAHRRKWTCKGKRGRWGRLQLWAGKRGLSNTGRMQQACNGLGTWSGRWTHLRHPVQRGFPVDYEWCVLYFWHQTPWRKTPLVETWMTSEIASWVGLADDANSTNTWADCISAVTVMKLY